MYRCISQKGLRMLALEAVLILILCTPAWSMDRWAALSQIESGDNDQALGSAGEISRYQIKPHVWKRYAPAKADWKKAQDSLPVAKQAMRDRCADFQRTFGRPPTDFEFYILWNAPAQIQKPSEAVARRAERFSNLVRSTNKKATARGPDKPPDSGQGLRASN